MTNTEKIVNALTGAEIVQAYTAEQEADAKATNLELEKEAKIAITKAAEKAAAQAKLAALGLTTDDLKALGLGGN